MTRTKRASNTLSTYRCNAIQKFCLLTILLGVFAACSTNQTKNDKRAQMSTNKTASEILGNPEYLAISYGGYREISRDTQPTIPQLKNDMKILAAMGIKVLRTYNTHYKQAANLLQAISELKAEDTDFEMYVMLGVWIDCQNAWTDTSPNHDAEHEAANASEIQRTLIQI